jgi:hypothetical protein
MHSYSNLYTFASYKNSVTVNFIKPTTKPYNSLTDDYPSLEPTEYPILEPPPPPLRIKNNTCICKIERNNDDKILIIATSITSSLCAVLFITLIWYRFIFKRNLLKWNKDNENFGFGP